MDLSLRQLEAYAAVARAGSFTTAARELRVSQSSLSRTVAEVEHRLRVTLLRRTTRRVRVTPEGDELLRVADRLLAAHRQEMERLGRYLEGSRGVVTIATLPSVAAVLLPSVVAALRAQEPEIDVRIVDGLSRAVVERVQRGEADVGLTVPHGLPTGLRTQRLVQDRFFAALPPGHAAAAQHEVSWSALSGEQFVAVGSESSVRHFTDHAFAEAGVQVAGLIETTNVATVGGLVSAGLGVSALPSLVRALMSFAALEHRPLCAPVVHRGLAVLVRADGVSPPARRFLDLLAHLRDEQYDLPPGVTWW
jgi:LysR family transcriptional regulator, carnitine catabolism transcriptional activator